MIAVLGVDAESGCWNADVFALEPDEEYASSPSLDVLRELIRFAVQFQAMRGGGTFMLSLAER